jgi:hypothetical protein
VTNAPGHHRSDEELADYEKLPITAKIDAAVNAADKILNKAEAGDQSSAKEIAPA